MSPAATVELEAIRACLQGAIPSPFATVAADGTPNVTYLSIVQYVDRERVATSRQFLNKTRANLDANPHAQTVVVDPATGAQYALDLRHLHTETEGEAFETMRASLEAIASHTGMGTVFRLRGVDIHRVVRCTRVGGTAAVEREGAAAARDLLEPLDDLVRRLAQCTSYEATTRVALEALDDLFGFTHTILLVADPGGGRLFAVASAGYPDSAVGAEVEPGAGLIGIAAVRGRIVREANRARSRAMAAAITGAAAAEIPLPGLPTARSACAVPLVVGGDVLGVLYLESEEAAAFDGAEERLLRIVGGHLGAALAARGGGPVDEHHEAPAPPVAAPPAPRAAEPLSITYYQADDSVLCGGEYLVKGVPGRILWRLLREHAATGRTAFTNRELRLDEALGLPAGNDNLEARLLVLRRRLAERDHGLTLERVGRGRLELTVARPLQLADVPTGGPFRS